MTEHADIQLCIRKCKVRNKNQYNAKNDRFLVKNWV